MPAASMIPVTGQSHLSLIVTHRLRRGDASYIVQVSSDFQIWNSGPGYTVIVEDTDTRLVMRDAVASSGNAKRFIRLAVQALP